MGEDAAGDAIGGLRDEYLRSLVIGSGREADRVVREALDGAVAPQRIYLDIFQPSAYAIGRLWQANKISVAGEHLATAIIERQMGELHPLFKPARELGRTMVLGCVPDEWHRVGARMVADFFEADGWEVHYLGANVPIADLVGLARETSADLVGLSAEMLFNLPRVAELVRALERAGLGGIPVIAGGMPFIEQAGLARALNLRGSAPNAADAVALAEAVVGADVAPSSPTSEESAAGALAAVRQRIVAEATAARAAAGDADGERIAAGYGYVLRMVEAALVAGSPALLDAQLSWGRERHPHDGVAPGQVLARLSALADAVRGALPGDQGRAAETYVNYLIERQRELMA